MTNQLDKKILVLGGSGKIGHSLIRHIGPGRVDCPDRKTIDLFKPSQVLNAIQWDNYSSVVYCAGINGRHILTMSSEKTEAVNIHSPQRIAEISRKLGIKFCYLSSDDVFDGFTDDAYNEESRANPINRYGQEKLAAETAIFSTNKDAAVVRLPIIYGGSINQAKHIQFLDKVIQSAMTNSGNWSVSSRCVTNPSCLNDLLPVMTHIALDRQLSGIFHVCNTESMSMYDFAKLIKEELNSSIQIKPVDGTFSTENYQKKEYAPLTTNRLPSLRSCTEALRDYLSELTVTN